MKRKRKITAVSRRKTIKVDNLEASVVVIGSGGGGLAAAVAAAEKGVKGIIVLEKLGFLGGNSGLDTGPHGLFAAESPVQKREKIDAPRDKFFKMAMDWAHWKINPRIVRTFIDKSGDTIRWLEEKGIEFDLMPDPTPILVRHIPKGDWSNSGPKLIEILAGECKEHGVQLLTRTPAKKILTGAKGNITGVLAGTKGKEFTIMTKNVIIASGGFGGNKKLLEKYCPLYRDNMELAESLPIQGDGLLMATAIGAATEGLGTLLLVGPIPSSAVFVKFEGQSEKVPLILGAITSRPYMLWVNKKGERFADETIGMHKISGHIAAQQPDNVTYSLFDSKTVQTISEQGLPQFVAKDEVGKKITGLEAGLRALVGNDLSTDGLGHRITNFKGPWTNIKGPWVKVSGSWDEIADWIGAERKVLNSTIDEYNTACDQGHDQLFAKERKYLVPLLTPPYYAIKCDLKLEGTIGGIKINEHMEVIDKRGNPIPGLYAVGVDAGGWESEAYCPFLFGSTLSFAVNSGRIAGDNLAKLILKNRG